MPLDFTDLIPDAADDEETGRKSSFTRNQAWTKPGPRSFTTKLPPEQEAKFQAWVKDNKVPFEDGETADYDMRGYWKASQDKTDWKRMQKAGMIPADLDPAGTKVDPNDGKPHYPDYWKTPYHETFSNESQWAVKDKAPKWTDDDKLVTPDGKVVFDDRARKPEPSAPLSFDDLVPQKKAAPPALVPDTPGAASAPPAPPGAQPSGPDMLTRATNAIFGDPTKGPQPDALTRIGNAAVSGARDAWSASGQPNPETVAANANADRDFPTLAPAIHGLNYLYDQSGRPLSAAFRGAQAGVAQLGTELGSPALGRDLAALPESLPDLSRPGAEPPRPGTSLTAPARPPEPGVAPGAGPGPTPPAPAPAPLTFALPAPEPKPAAPPAEAPAAPTNRVTYFDQSQGEYATGTLKGMRPDGMAVVDRGTGVYIFVHPGSIIDQHEAAAPAERPTSAAPSAGPTPAAETQTATLPPLTPDEAPVAPSKTIDLGGKSPSDTLKDGKNPLEPFFPRAPTADNPLTVAEIEQARVAAQAHVDAEAKNARATLDGDKPNPSTAHGGPWTEAGKNDAGEMVYKNPDGRHAVFENGIPWAEAPGTSDDKRKKRYQIGPEGKAEQPTQTADKPAATEQPSPVTTDAAKKPKKKPGTTGATSVDAPGWSYVGDNEDGQKVYKDQRGVHSYVKDGMRITEPVSMKPGASGMEISVPDADSKPTEFRVAPEKVVRSASQIAAEDGVPYHEAQKIRDAEAAEAEKPVESKVETDERDPDGHTTRPWTAKDKEDAAGLVKAYADHPAVERVRNAVEAGAPVLDIAGKGNPFTPWEVRALAENGGWKAKPKDEAPADRTFTLDPAKLTDELAGATGFSREAVAHARQTLVDHGGDVPKTLGYLDAGYLNGKMPIGKEAAQVIRAMKPSMADTTPDQIKPSDKPAGENQAGGETKAAEPKRAAPKQEATRPARTGDARPSYWMNEGEVDENIDRFKNHPLLGQVTNWLGAYRDAVNENSDGWAHFGASVAKPLMGLIHQSDPRNSNYWTKHGGTIEATEAEIKAAIAPIKAFATKHNLNVPAAPIAEAKGKKPRAKRTPTPTIQKIADTHGVDTDGLTTEQILDDVVASAPEAAIKAEVEALVADAETEMEAAEDEAREWIVYHGTPHDVDRFSLDKIGTGEGNQAFGYGLYFAENEGVARSYRDQLSGAMTPENAAAYRAASDQYADARREAEGLEDLMVHHSLNKGMSPDPGWGTLGMEHHPDVIKLFQPKLDALLAKQDAATKAMDAAMSAPRASGNLYTVRIAVKPEEMLDWDSTLKNQPDQVRENLKKVGIGLPIGGEWEEDRPGTWSYRDKDGKPLARVRRSQSGKYWASGGKTETGAYSLDEAKETAVALSRALIEGDDQTGAQIYHEVVNNIGLIREGAAQKASEALHAAGVKGIRYFDAGSRRDAEGTRNVVIFNPDDIEITHRNGEPVKPHAPTAAETKELTPEPAITDIYPRPQDLTPEAEADEFQQNQDDEDAQQRDGGGEEPGAAGAHTGEVPEGRGEVRGGGGVDGRGGSQSGAGQKQLGRVKKPQGVEDGRGDGPVSGGVGEQGSGKTGTSGVGAGKSARKRPNQALESSSAEDAAPTGRGEDDAKVRDGAGTQAVSGDAAVHQGGDASNGRGRAGDEGVASDGTGSRGPKPATIRPNFHVDDPERLIGGTPKVRFARNRAALEALEAIEQDQRDPTPEELEAMAGYIGWGSFGQDLFQGTFERQMSRPGWDAEGKWLREQLGKEAWESAQRSIINAHYTDPPTVMAMWDMVRQMGFKGGRVLEPSMGIGNFFGMMPRDLMAKSTLTGIELDRVTGAMAKHLYPDAGIHIKGYQDSKTPDNFYDLVIGNWPFAAGSPPDRRYDKLSPTLHDYFFLKALDQTRPGGLVVGITSSGTMDKAGRAARLEMAKKGELLAAFRLPSGAFEKYAGTSVVTDIIILRKRAEPAANVTEEPWINATDMDTPYGQAIRVNDYFQNRPDAVLGQLDFGHGTTQGRAGMIVHRPDNLLTRLQGLAARLPEDGYQPVIRGKEPRFLINNTTDRQGSVTIGDDGKLYQVQGERLALLEDVHKGMKAGTAKIQKAREDQVRRMVGMRKAYGALIDAERDGKPEAETLRKALAKQYGEFKDQHGTIGESDGLKVLRLIKDPAHPALQSLERPDGEPSRILTEPTIRSKRSLDKPSVAEAYVLARNEQANFDMDRVAELAKTTREKAEAHLLETGAVLRAPGSSFEPADIYLSGNVRRKLLEAKEALANGEDMQASIDALTKALPPTVPYYQVEAKLGAPWVGDAAYKAFIGDLLGLSPEDRNDIHVRFAGSRWKVTFAAQYLNHKPEATSVWGHHKYPFNKLIMAAMGNNVVQIKSKNDDGDNVFDPKLTEEVNAKIQALREKFQDWAWQDPERKIAFEAAYNDVMNAIAKPQFDGSFMDMSGMALRRGDDPFSLRRHQINAIWRGVIQGRGLFAHEVGTGKTYTMGGIAVEGRRYGVFRKPLIFAHNANSASVAKEIGDMYPGGKFLYIDNLAPDVIATTLHRIANEDWDAVVMPHSLIDRMALTRETLHELAAEQIAELENEAIEAAKEDGINLTPQMMDDDEAMKKVRSVTAKQLVKQRQNILDNIEKQGNRSSKEGAVSFEKLGVDAIVVDEAHEFKKPPIATRMQLKGLNTQTSNRSIALNFLTQYVKKQNAGKGVYLFTGTPVTNSLNEIFNMSRYFMDDRMGQSGIKDWDTWFNTFADAMTDVELTAAGTYEPVKRLSAFVNVDELVRMMSEYTDVVQAKEMPEFVPRATKSGKTLASPDLTPDEMDYLTNGRMENPEGRPYKKVVTDVGEMSPDQKDILATLRERSEYFKNASRKERKEMMLKGDERTPIRVETDAANASLDARMYDEEAPDFDGGKATRVVKNVMKHYAEDKAAQVIFVDRGDNPGVRSNFVLMQDLIKKLVDGGVPRGEIAIVGGGMDAKKKKEVADAMNSGKIRVVIGKSSTLGVGVNMQRYLRAMHHLDAPWRPGDLEQRNGRGERQGNEWNTVLEYRYVTEGIDGRRWQVLTSKDKFIKQFIGAFNDDSGKRIGNIEGDAADISDDEDIMQTLSAAAGDPRIMLRAKYKADVERMERRERMHTVGQAEAVQRARQLRSNLEHYSASADRIGGLAKIWAASVDRMEAAAREAKDTHRWYEATVDGKELRLGAEIQEAIDAKVRGLVRGEETEIATVGGFKVIADWRSRYAAEPNYSVADADGNDVAPLTGPGIRFIANALNRLRGESENYIQMASEAKASIPAMDAAGKQDFPQQGKLDKLRQQFSRLESDLQSNPIPPPSWLRHGAAIDSDIYVDGKPRTVRGHRMDDDYYLVTDEGEVPYMDAKDVNGLPIYEAHPAPEGVEQMRFRRDFGEDDGGTALRDDVAFAVRLSSDHSTHEFERGYEAKPEDAVESEYRKGRHWVRVAPPKGEKWSRDQAIDAAIRDAFPKEKAAKKPNPSPAPK
jgi:N12 class adenine-specific DNA methylase